MILAILAEPQQLEELEQIVSADGAEIQEQTVGSFLKADLFKSNKKQCCYIFLNSFCYTNLVDESMTAISWAWHNECLIFHRR